MVSSRIPPHSTAISAGFLYRNSREMHLSLPISNAYKSKNRWWKKNLLSPGFSSFRRLHCLYGVLGNCQNSVRSRTVFTEMETTVGETDDIIFLENDCNLTSSIIEVEPPLISSGFITDSGNNGADIVVVTDQVSVDISEIDGLTYSEKSKRRCRLCSNIGHDIRTCPTKGEGHKTSRARASERIYQTKEVVYAQNSKRCCRFCGGLGHNIRTCSSKNKVVEIEPVGKVTGQSANQSEECGFVENRVRSCRLCRKVGHNARSCVSRKKGRCCRLCGNSGHNARTCESLNTGADSMQVVDGSSYEKQGTCCTLSPMSDDGNQICVFETHSDSDIEIVGEVFNDSSKSGEVCNSGNVAAGDLGMLSGRSSRFHIRRMIKEFVENQKKYHATGAK